MSTESINKANQVLGCLRHTFKNMTPEIFGCCTNLWYAHTWNMHHAYGYHGGWSKRPIAKGSDAKVKASDAKVKASAERVKASQEKVKASAVEVRHGRCATNIGEAGL